MNEKIKAMHVQVAEKIIQQLKDGTAPWQKPWDSNGVPGFELPYNAVSGNRYKGINIFSLMQAGHEDPRWMTFNQAHGQGWQVKKGEKASLVQFVKISDLVTKRDEAGKVVLGEDGKPVKMAVKLERPIISSAWVFNASQVDGVPQLVAPTVKELSWNPLERAESLVSASGADIRHKFGNRAYYSPIRDQITMPRREQFDAADKYYSTLLHELGHWTGHKDRLDRSLINRFGSEGYAREELRAEIASLLIGQEFRIGHDPGQHAAYVESWIKLLQDHPFEIHAAAADAEKICTYLKGLELKRDLGATQETVKDEKQTLGSHLTMGDRISYNGTEYAVTGNLKNGRVKLEDVSTGQPIVVSRTDGLYSSLLEAKNYSPKQASTNMLDSGQTTTIEQIDQVHIAPKR